MAKKLRDWLSNWDLNQPLADISINHLTLDSRQVAAGDCFIAIQGNANNGEDYIAQAIAQGAVAIMVDAESKVTTSEVVVIKVAEISNQLPALAKAFYQQ